MHRPGPKFQKRLKEIVGDNITEFARRVGLSQPLVHGYISGRYAPGFDFFLALSNHGVDVNWLLTGDTEDRTTTEKGFAKAQQIILLLSKLSPKQADVVLKTMETLVDELSGSRAKAKKPQ